MARRTHGGCRREARFTNNVRSEMQDGLPVVYRPTRRLVPTCHAFQVHPVFLEVKVFLVSANGTNKTLESPHMFFQHIRRKNRGVGFHYGNNENGFPIERTTVRH